MEDEGLCEKPSFSLVSLTNEKDGFSQRPSFIFAYPGIINLLKYLLILMAHRHVLRSYVHSFSHTHTSIHTSRSLCIDILIGCISIYMY